jgi:hypothetical protein
MSWRWPALAGYRTRNLAPTSPLICLSAVTKSPGDSATSSRCGTAGKTMYGKRYLTASVGALFAAILFLSIAITARSVAMPEAAATTDIILDLRTSLLR